MDNEMIYFDHAATSPLSKNVLNKINFTYKNFWGNVSSTYKFGLECASELEILRTKIADKFNADSEDIIFTSGSSESISLVFNNISDSYRPGNITISSIEHQATIIQANKMRKKGWNVNEWEVDNEGRIIMDYLDKYINNKVKFVSIIWGQSEIGTLQPIQEVGKKCSEYGILFHIDGTQIISNGIFNWQKLKCDLLSLSAHKFGGPKGIGILLTNKDSRKLLRNNDISISHEYSIRQGTQALPLISGLSQALDNIKGRIKFSNNNIEFTNNKIILKTYLLNKIKNNKNFQITGSINDRLPNHISFIVLNKNFIPIEAYKIVNLMSDNNIAISSGSACSSSKNIPSRVLYNIGLEKNQLYSNIRLSFNEDNNINEVDKFYKILLECIKKF
tara:strand:- start:2965 stop:4134 length:1170 start_codon:yes stop_codon:yes gene_type:complete